MTTISNDYIITTTRCRLRRPEIGDLVYVWSATREPGFNDGMLWDPPEGIDELREPFDASLKAWASGQAFSFTIEDIASMDFRGRISIRKQPEDGLWDLGFWTHPKHQGCGFMTEATGAILAFGFNRLNALRIEACHAIWNKPSQRVLEKNGMTFSRYFERGFQKHGQWVAENLLAITREEWLNKTSNHSSDGIGAGCQSHPGER